MMDLFVLAFGQQEVAVSDVRCCQKGSRKGGGHKKFRGWGSSTRLVPAGAEGPENSTLSRLPSDGDGFLGFLIWAETHWQVQVQAGASCRRGWR